MPARVRDGGVLRTFVGLSAKIRLTTENRNTLQCAPVLDRDFVFRLFPRTLRRTPQVLHSG